jgi:hypothetical protein
MPFDVNRSKDFSDALMERTMAEHDTTRTPSRDNHLTRRAARPASMTR